MAMLIIRHPPGAPERGVIAGTAPGKRDAVQAAMALAAREPESEFAVYAPIGRIVPNPVRHLFEEYDR